MKSNRKRKLTIFALAMLAIFAIAGVWAYFQATNTIKNEMSTISSYGAETREKFTPETSWQPGMTVDKKVHVKNTGASGLLVRIKFTESWTGSQTDLSIPSSDSKFNPSDNLTSLQAVATDGLTASDGSVVFKNLVGVSSNTWTMGTDGYYYYNSILAAGQDSTALLQDLTLCLDTDMGNIGTTNYYTTAATEPDDTAIGTTAADAGTKWVAYTGVVPAGATFTRAASNVGTENGYTNAKYGLDIVTEVVQATKEARDAVVGTSTNPWLPALTPAIP